MGIDRSNVRFVVHAGAPRSLEHYQQESGRAGRDGLEAECVLISSAADFMKWRRMLEQSGELSDANQGLLRQMERYATGVGCRHRYLAEYFGDDYPTETTGTQGGCAACDFCLDELEPVAAPVVLARQILSCVARVGQRFGATHVASILRGHASERVVARGHEKLSTFGLLPHASVTEVRGYIEQLTGLGLLQQAGEEYPVLALTPTGLELLKDATRRPDLRLARQRKPRKEAKRAQSRAEAESWQGRRSRALRPSPCGSARDRPVARRAALRDLPRRDTAGDGPTSAHVARRVPDRQGRWRAEGRRPGRDLPHRDPQPLLAKKRTPVPWGPGPSTVCVGGVGFPRCGVSRRCATIEQLSAGGPYEDATSANLLL